MLFSGPVKVNKPIAIMFIVLLFSGIIAYGVERRCFERYEYDLWAKPVLIQTINPITGKRSEPRIGSPNGEIFKENSTDQLPFMKYVVDKWAPCR